MSKILQLWQEKPKQVIILGVILLLAVASIIVNMPNSSYSSKGSSINILQQQQGEIEVLIAEYEELQSSITQIGQLNSRLWIPLRDGNPKMAIRQHIENCAVSSTLMIKSIGRLQESQITERVYSYEIVINGDGKWEAVLDFMSKMTENRVYHWKSLSLNPDSVTDPKHVMLNGVVMVIVVDDTLATELLEDKK